MLFGLCCRKNLALQVKYGKCKTNGSRTHLGGMLVNIEVKNEIGSGGGAPHVQNATDAAAYAFQTDIRQTSVCPTLLIELAGPNMSFSGAVFTDLAIRDQLTPTVSLLWQPHSSLMLQAARCITALRAALLSLRTFYDILDAEAKAKQQLQRQLLYPYPAAFTDLHDTQVQLTYTDKLGRLCFKGVVDQMGHQTPVFVKFCRSYHRGAHDLLASKGFAPPVLGLMALPGGWFMVIMRFVVDGCPWDESVSKTAEALQAAVQVLHQAGFVHGDLRSNNIVQDGIHTVDFEWAGIADQATYPFFMNHTDLKWPDGASDGLPITKGHDLP